MLEGSILDRLRKQLDQDPPSYGVYYKNTLVALCHALEDHILSCGSEPLVIAAFQRGKWYAQEAERYKQIAERSRQVLIMAVPESGFVEAGTTDKDNVTLLGLEASDPVSVEWHLIILAPTYAAQVMCQELSEADYGAGGVPQVDSERKFYGFWTFEESIVRQTIGIVLEHIDRYDPQLRARIEQEVERIEAQPALVRADLSGVVARIVGYLQTSQQQLVTLTRQPQPIYSSEPEPDKLGSNLVSNKLQAFLRMVQLIDRGDSSNAQATAEVTSIAETMAQLMGLPFGRLRRLRLAALLHRIGLSEIPSSISDPDSHAAREALAQAAQFGAELLRSMPELRTVARIVEHQWEQWDGRGLPEALEGEDIPLESRILGLAAYFQEWMVSRGTRQALSATEALARCEDRAGQYWDPRLIEPLTNIVRLLQAGILLDPVKPQLSNSQWLLATEGVDEREGSAVLEGNQ